MIKFNKKRILVISVIAILIGFNSVFAKDFGEVVMGFKDGILNTVTSAALVFAFLFFLWRLFDFMLKLGNDAGGSEVEEGKKWLTHAIIILFVFISIFALVNLVEDSLKLDNSSKVQIDLSTHSLSGDGSSVQ